MTQRALTHIYDVSISHWAARFLAGEQVAPWQCTRPFPAIHPNDCRLGNGLACQTSKIQCTKHCSFLLVTFYTFMSKLCTYQWKAPLSPLRLPKGVPRDLKIIKFKSPSNPILFHSIDWSNPPPLGLQIYLLSPGIAREGDSGGLH